MFSTIATFGLLAAVTSAATQISVTPHDKFSSSIGVLGCKVDVNRVAYFPSFPPCDTVCVKVKSNGRELNLLHIDQSGGAYDISYDAWNYLNVGESALVNPTDGGGIPATYEKVDMSECEYLIDTEDGKLPLMAANSIGYYVGCGADSWVGKNSGLWNIQNSACTLGFNEQCDLDLAVSNQPACPHQLGLQNVLKHHPVLDINYRTGKMSIAE